MSDNDLAILSEMVLKVSKAVEPLDAPDNYWSVDVCLTNDFEWVVTDMALAPQSFHYNTCKNASEEMKKYPGPETIPKYASLGDLKKLSKNYAGRFI